jgi:hypothetical protein
LFKPRLTDPVRLAHLIWRVQDGKLPPAAIIGLESPSAPLQDAIAGAGPLSVNSSHSGN